MVQDCAFQLSTMTPADAGAISKLHCRLFEKGWDPESVQRLLAHPACVALMATSHLDASVVGFIIAQLTADEAEILSVGVEKNWQRKRVGRALVEALIELAKRKEARRLFLDVAESNVAALALYARLNFTCMGARKDYYLHPDGRHENALLMVRDL